ncbi:MAG: TraB/GumN family protein [Methanobacteriota archaeon]
MGSLVVITLLGIGHVFDLRGRLQEEILRREPTLVCLELDRPRFEALRDRRARGRTPLLYRTLGKMQERLAEGFGVKAGDEMLAAAEAARFGRAGLALIDMDAGFAFRRLWREMGLRERLRFVGSILFSGLASTSSVEAELSKVREDPDRYIEALGREFPTVKRVLIDERNAFMARHLQEVAARHPRIVAVVGDGHVAGLAEILRASGAEVEAVRLRELSEVRGGPSMSFSVEVDGG